MKLPGDSDKQDKGASHEMMQEISAVYDNVWSRTCWDVGR